MKRAEENGRAADNPYAKGVLSDYVLPLAEVIRSELGEKKAGARRAHVKLLAGLDADAVAYLAVRATINCMLSPDKDKMATTRSIGSAIGKAVHSELVLVQFEYDNPDLYHSLNRDLGRRMSKDETHRLYVFRNQAEKNNLDIIEWPLGARQQVGLYLLDRIAELGMVEVEPQRIVRGKYEYQAVTLQADLIDRINRVQQAAGILMPAYGPCVEPPIDWETAYGGGWHTPALRRAHWCLIRHPLSRSGIYRDVKMPRVLAAVNALQRTPWAVNARMLDTVKDLARNLQGGEVVMNNTKPMPVRPPWLNDDKPKDQWSDDEKAGFLTWKRAMSEWHTDNKLVMTKVMRLSSAVRVAETYREYPAIFFVHFADSRGRLYPMTTGISPQGSDLQKALLHFADGKPLWNDQAVGWFLVQGANKWGFDKATLTERREWSEQHCDDIVRVAENPLDNRWWRDADSPLQFLSWCFEYADWKRDPQNFRSHLPVSMDGSCNGLQNLSALLRDEVGGRATNLIPNEKMEDIYRLVAEAATVRMQGERYEDEVKERCRQAWLAFGIGRGAVKRSVMTTPYGVTKRSAIDYVVEDILKKGLGPPSLDKTEWYIAAAVLMDSAWPAIGDIVVKGVQAMSWLKKGAGIVLRNRDMAAEPIISWVSPSGFPAAQAYFEEKVHRINTHIAGGVKIRIHSETDVPDLDAHANGMAPNFVHSLDAAHLHLTAAAAWDAGINALAMIHDDYGTHAADSQKLYEVLRDQFVRMYSEHSPLQDLINLYPDLPPPPAMGALSIEDVRNSPFFFS